MSALDEFPSEHMKPLAAAVADAQRAVLRYRASHDTATVSTYVRMVALKCQDVLVGIR